MGYRSGPICNARFLLVLGQRQIRSRRLKVTRTGRAKSVSTPRNGWLDLLWMVNTFNLCMQSWFPDEKERVIIVKLFLIRMNSFPARSISRVPTHWTLCEEGLPGKSVSWKSIIFIIFRAMHWCFHFSINRAQMFPSTSFSTPFFPYQRNDVSTESTKNVLLVACENAVSKLHVQNDP